MDIITYALLKNAGGGGGGDSSVVNGYYNPVDGNFYEDPSYTVQVTGKTDCLYVTDDTSKLYRFDGTNFIPIAGEGSIQVNTFPVASAAELGHIYQYVGGNTLQYTTGCFYRCEYDSTSETYEWNPISVEDPANYEDDPIDFNNDW